MLEYFLSRPKKDLPADASKREGGAQFFSECLKETLYRISSVTQSTGLVVILYKQVAHADIIIKPCLTSKAGLQ